MSSVVTAGLSVAPAGAPAPVLCDVHLRLGAGERLVVLGPSGAGKTTLLHALLGAGRRTAGTLVVDGVDPFDPAHRTALRRRCGLVLQGGDLVPRVRARTAAVSGSSHLLRAPDWWDLLRGRAPRTLGQRLQALADAQGVGHLLDRPVGNLSGGERQRVALVRALLPGPALVLADEPTAGLDPVAAAGAVDALLALPGGTGVVVTTHDPAVAARFPRVLALREGRVVHDGPPLDADQGRALYRRPAP